MESVVPAKLAFNLFEPSTGVDEKLSPVIFLHGVTAGKENWCDIPQRVADATKRRAYAIDARNHGDSEQCDVFSFNANVDDILHFMDTIKASKAILIGHSMGGITAQRAALRKPERIEMIIVEDMYTKNIPKASCEQLLESIQMRHALIQSTPVHLSDSEAIKFLIDTICDHFPEEKSPITRTPDVYNMKMTFVRQKDGTLDLKFDKERVLKAIEDCEGLLDEPSGQYQGPAHFIYGGRSTLLVGEEKEHIKMHFPNAEFTEFETATHYVHLEYPNEFTNKVIQAFNEL